MKKEFSKGLVERFIAVFCLHLVMSICVMVFSMDGEMALCLFEACIPVYVTVFGGYYGKAAVENANKIKNAALGTASTSG